MLSLLLVLFTISGIDTQSSCATAQNCTNTTLNNNNNNNNNTAVQCINNTCICTECFNINAQDLCILNSRCYLYSQTGVCESTAADWLTALLLHTFLGLLGVANFYLGHIGLGVTQLFLLALTILCPILAEYPSYYLLESIKNKNSTYTERRKICLGVIVSVLSVLSIVSGGIVVLWWIVELVLLATNSRLDGNWCQLNTK